MYAAAVDLAASPELILQESSLSQQQLMFFLLTGAVVLLSGLCQFMWYGHGQAGGRTAQNEAVSLRQACVSDSDCQSGGQLQDPQELGPGSSRRRWKKSQGGSSRPGAENRDSRKALRECMGLGELQAFEGAPEEAPERAPEGAPRAPDVPMPFQKREVKFGHLGHRSDVPSTPQSLHPPPERGQRHAEPEPCAWPMPFRDEYPQTQSSGGQEVQPGIFWAKRRLAASSDAQLLPDLSQDEHVDFVQGFAPLAWDPMGLNENAPNAPKPAWWGSLRLAALFSVPMPLTPRPPPGLPPPPPPLAHFATSADDNVRPRLMRHLRESLRESSIPSELSESNPLVIPSIGSFGHPDMCYRPCLYLEKGCCKRDAFCTHCHFDHEKTHKLAKNHKKFVETQLDEVSVLAGLLPYIHAKAIERGLQREVGNLCALIQRRVELLSMNPMLRYFLLGHMSHKPS